MARAADWAEQTEEDDRKNGSQTHHRTVEFDVIGDEFRSKSFVLRSAARMIRRLALAS